MNDQAILSERAFWEGTFVGVQRTIVNFATTRPPERKSAIPAEHRNAWIDRLFEGLPPGSDRAGSAAEEKLVILKNGIEIHQVPATRLRAETVIGRHPRADLQLEDCKLALFHAVIRKLDGQIFIESIDVEFGILVNRKWVKPGTRVRLGDGALVDVPGFQLRFHLVPDPESAATPNLAADLQDVPSWCYSERPAPSPVLANLVEDRDKIGMWSGGLAILTVVDIIEESSDAKTFRLAGKRPLMFSYRPGQFLTLLLKIGGLDVERSYSISSSPSRPHVLEITVKRVPGGAVSNWLCDHIRLGQMLTVKGPAGKFSCFEYPANKMLFIAAGSGIAPLMSMSRWIADTAADVDVRFLASFRSQSDIIFGKELELLSSRHNHFRVLVTLTGAGGNRNESWTGLTGRIDASMIRLLAPDVLQRHVFVCGPEPFAAEARRILRELSFDFSKLHTESFGSGGVARGVNGGGKALQLSGPRHRVTFRKSGVAVETDETVTILELAEAHGVEMNYACRTGNCGECEVRFSGRLAEKPDYQATPTCKEKGLAYACCSVALADVDVEA